MTARRFLAGGGSARTPAQAKRLYRHPRWRHLALDRSAAAVLPAEPAVALNDVRAEHRALRRRFRHRDEAKDIWGNAIRRWRKVAGVWLLLWFGDCDDFVWLLVIALVKAGRPRGALRLCTCEVRVPGRKPEGHMVLAVATDQGTLICDPLQDDPRWADDPVFEGHGWRAIEKPPPVPKPGAGRWLSLRRRSLEETLHFNPQA